MIANAYDAEIDSIYYSFSGDETTVTYKTYYDNIYFSDYSGAVVIPASVLYDAKTYSVTSIGNNTFNNSCALISIIIPGSVTSVDAYTFSGCNALTSVQISDLESWCKIDFDYNSANPLLYAIHLFLNGEEIKDLVIPASVTKLGHWTFTSCSGLTSVTIPKGVTSIGA